MKNIGFLFTFLLGIVFACSESSQKKRGLERVNLNNTMELDYQELDTATFAGGCFWCTEAYFERVEGVKKVISGYSGGTTPNPTYQEVSAGRTNYAEAVEVYFDPNEVSYQTLLQVFFATMDPTQLNRQGPDIGEQYRSVVFFHDQQQQNLAQEYIQKLSESGKYNKPIVTKVQPYERFYVAEDYHQDYYELNPRDPYVRQVARPKVEKLEKEYQELLKPEYQD